MLHRRDFYRFGSIVLGGVMGAILAVPGAAYVIDPILRKKGAAAKGGGRHELARLDQLEVGVPQAFPIVDERQDAWVKYPREPIGAVWLIRQPAGVTPAVMAFTAECPHLGCAVNLTADAKSFKCPCHDSGFDLKGKPTNRIPPRGMDSLKVELSDEADPRITVTFERFRAQSEEKIPLV